ncbi:hypothetical protein CD113_11490 [Staphylococcus simiae]|uniref:Uncharacterized protein n=2 Tax=Staphylococcus simiae TaxID=308354 RepID=G5JJW6_9STAP|nr:hypothetical protein SS7213T_08887 [Staphylococcus simiae CCM 7213 = CCUG 51256]PNZ09845.1 hypothetical protein CD113_11490 [Staphylococcus simiae]
MLNVIDELVEWSVYMITHKKGELSNINRLEIMKINAQNQYTIASIKNINFVPVKNKFYQLTLFNNL